MKHQIVELPGVCVAAGGGGDTVWCGAGGRLLRFAHGGSPQFDGPLPEGVTHLAMRGTALVASLASAEIAWLDPQTAAVIGKRPAGRAPLLASGGGSVWAVDRSTAQAWKVGEPGVLDGPRKVPGVEGAAADRDRLWWIAGNVLRDFERTVQLDVDTAEIGGFTLCAGSVWISVTRGLIRVGAWAGEKGPIVEAPDGSVPFLSCANGVLVGASERGRVFVLDPNTDADARALDVDAGPTSALVTTSETAWLFSSTRPQAHVIAVRTG